MKPFLLRSFGLFMLCASVWAQSAEWEKGIWHEPQVRYLLADMTLGGKVQLYREYATKEGDPDSREAIRLWDSRARVVNTNEFERRWVTNQFGKDGRVMRVVQRGTERTITGNEVLLTSDLGFRSADVRRVLAQFALGRPIEDFESGKVEINAAEAVRRWKAGVRVLNTNWFELRGSGAESKAYYKPRPETTIDGAHVRLNSDTPYSEPNVRYFLADMYLGGSREFYHRSAEAAHEKGCEEAVARFDHGVKISNLDEFERKKVDGKTLITRKGSNERIHGMAVKLSSDLNE